MITNNTEIEIIDNYCADVFIPSICPKCLKHNIKLLGDEALLLEHVIIKVINGKIIRVICKNCGEMLSIDDFIASSSLSSLYGLAMTLKNIDCNKKTIIKCNNHFYKNNNKYYKERCTYV